ncbi:hypothetical protein QBC44DRAFT_372289 [Cladorrhinum sp. PSN332]|nr:hypothetical protein QBC44DRAFT_372289 [Cladorrhinum sp. PSN332]
MAVPPIRVLHYGGISCIQDATCAHLFLTGIGGWRIDSPLIIVLKCLFNPSVFHQVHVQILPNHLIQAPPTPSLSRNDSTRLRPLGLGWELGIASPSGLHIYHLTATAGGQCHSYQDESLVGARLQQIDSGEPLFPGRLDYQQSVAQGPSLPHFHFTDGFAGDDVWGGSDWTTFEGGFPIDVASYTQPLNHISTPFLTAIPPRTHAPGFVSTPEVPPCFPIDPSNDYLGLQLGLASDWQQVAPMVATVSNSMPDFLGIPNEDLLSASTPMQHSDQASAVHDIFADLGLNPFSPGVVAPYTGPDLTLSALAINTETAATSYSGDPTTTAISQDIVSVASAGKTKSPSVSSTGTPSQNTPSGSSETGSYTCQECRRMYSTPLKLRSVLDIASSQPPPGANQRTDSIGAITNTSINVITSIAKSLSVSPRCLSDI